ncbi:unnamed protein product [Pleuronectes platessa]|uniref:Uncharacterized protein n=1 Tax=Pleuronectes platessa TaxID=8262 RepID=A0A9N7VX57_PLEPL|nr:unnamed protein product [Pleuronectes platessa]
MEGDGERERKPGISQHSQHPLPPASPSASNGDSQGPGKRSPTAELSKTAERHREHWSKQTALKWRLRFSAQAELFSSEEKRTERDKRRELSGGKLTRFHGKRRKVIGSSRRKWPSIGLGVGSLLSLAPGRPPVAYLAGRGAVQSNWQHGERRDECRLPFSSQSLRLKKQRAARPT